VLRCAINSSDPRYGPVENFLKVAIDFKLNERGKSWFDKQLSVCQNQNYYVLKWKHIIKHESESWPIYFAYGNLRSKILHLDDTPKREIVFCYVSQAEETRYFKMVEIKSYIIIKLNLWGTIEKITYVHSRCFVFFSAQNTDFSNESF
jgi:hypothetical protein